MTPLTSGPTTPASEEDMLSDVDHRTEDADSGMDETAQAKQDAQAVKVLNRKIAGMMRTAIADNARQKAQLHQRWRRNVELRLARPIGGTVVTFEDANDDLQSEINPDWYLTKAKVANLFSQLPAVQGTHENTAYAAAVYPFVKQINYELGEKRGNARVAMKEVLNDVVNAAGVGAIMVDYVARYEDVPVPAVDVSRLDPAMVDQAIQRGLIPTKTSSRVVSDKTAITRVAPMDLIWPAEFSGSNFDDGDLIGYRGRMSPADGSHQFDLTPEQLEKAQNASPGDSTDSLRVDARSDRNRVSSQKLVYERLFYWRHRYDKNEGNMRAIWEIVFVHGIKTPVVHRPWNGQEQDERSGAYLGACRFPVRVLTLTYVSDNPITMSDSEAGRPQVNDLRRSRSQLFQNRQRSVPLRWFDVNRIGPEIQTQLQDGTWQGFVPTNGDGSRSVGEIARPSYPSEDLAFDQQTMKDLQDQWGMNAMALGQPVPGRKNQAEIGNLAQGFATNIGSDRAEVTAFFLSIVEVVAGFTALYSSFAILTPQEKQAMDAAWDRGTIVSDLVLKIRPNSMIVLDANARLSQLSNFLNLTVKSGFVNPKPVIIEMAELSDLDPAVVVIDPQPKQPDEPQFSFRATGKDDLNNPILFAMLMKGGRAPNLQEIDAAKQILLAAQQPAIPNPVPVGTPAPGGPPVGGLPPTPAGGSLPPHPADAEAHQGWAMASRIAKRSRDLSGGE